MNSQSTQLPGLRVTLTAHRDPAQQLLLATLTVDESTDRVQAAPTQPATLAVVIDRSGSMSGQKLDITKDAVALLIKSLGVQDKVAVIVYDDQVDLVNGLEAPSTAMARRVAAIQSGGSTNLYGGWVMGAKIVGRGGRVILLSDGLANHGMYTSARDLERHAAISYEKYGVTTTTIGIGEGYDEALMAGMARAGGGGHYFAHTAEAIVEAFSQERFSIGAIAMSQVSLKYGQIVKQLGHFWAGETKSAVLQIARLGDTASIRFTDRDSNQTHTFALDVPAEFGHSDNATLEALIEQAAELQSKSVQVRDPESAKEMNDRVRQLILGLLAHPLADTAPVVALIAQLQECRDRLDGLERYYDEHEATILRKRGMQTSYNLRERAKGFSSFQEDQVTVNEMRSMSVADSPATLVVAIAETTGLAPIEMWQKWTALPVAQKDGVLRIAMANPRDGFTIAEIEKQTGSRVRPIHRMHTPEEIQDALEAFLARTV